MLRGKAGRTHSVVESKLEGVVMDNIVEAIHPLIPGRPYSEARCEERTAHLDYACPRMHEQPVEQVGSM